jgi:hypothetical protein
MKAQCPPAHGRGKKEDHANEALTVISSASTSGYGKESVARALATIAARKDTGYGSAIPRSRRPQHTTKVHRARVEGQLRQAWATVVAGQKTSL